MSDHRETVRATVYDAATGIIIKAIECNDELLSMQIASGQAWIEGHYFAHTHHVVNGRPERHSPDIDFTLPSTAPRHVRQRSYPSMNDQLGAVMNWLELQRGNGSGGQPLTPELIALLDNIKAVKESIPVSSGTPFRRQDP